MNTQKTSTDIIVVLALIGAMVGVYSYIFWQNFAANEPAGTTSNQQTAKAN